MQSSGRPAAPRDPGDLPGEHRPHRAVGVADRHARAGSAAPLERASAPAGAGPGPGGPRRPCAAPRRSAGARRPERAGHDQHRREVEPPGLPVPRRPARRAEQVPPADDLVEGPRPQPGEQLAHLPGHEEEVVDHALGRALEALAQLRVLGGDAHRAGVEVALAQHHAAHRHQRRGGHPELLGPEQRGDHDVPTGAHPAVGLEADAAAHPVLHQRLVRLGHAQLPGEAGVLDAGDGRGAGAALVAGDDDAPRARLGDPGGHRAHAHLAHQLHPDARRGVDRLEVVDELGEVLDAVDVVVRRRRDERHPRRGAAHPGDALVHLVTGELAALAGLGALGDLDLQLVGVDQVLGGDAEAGAGHLLDRAAPEVAVGVGDVAPRLLAALAGVAAAADPVHRDRQRLVRLGADAPEAHRPGDEAPHDGLERLDLLDGDRAASPAPARAARAGCDRRGSRRRPRR